jgi:hypothetical protein
MSWAARASQGGTSDGLTMGWSFGGIWRAGSDPELSAPRPTSTATCTTAPTTPGGMAPTSTATHHGGTMPAAAKPWWAAFPATVNASKVQVSRRANRSASGLCRRESHTAVDTATPASVHTGNSHTSLRDMPTIAASSANAENESTAAAASTTDRPIHVTKPRCPFIGAALRNEPPGQPQPGADATRNRTLTSLLARLPSASASPLTPAPRVNRPVKPPLGSEVLHLASGRPHLMP